MLFFRNEYLFIFCFLGPHLQHMEVPRLVILVELQLQTYTTATPTWDPSCVCKLHHSSAQCRIPNPLSKGRDRTESSWILVRFISAVPQCNSHLFLDFYNHCLILILKENGFFMFITSTHAYVYSII